MAGTFQARMTELAERVGVGTLTAGVTFNQPYAHRQHEDLTPIWRRKGSDSPSEPHSWVQEEGAFKHPRGGGPKYLELALFEHYAEYYKAIAEEVLNEQLELVDVMAVVGTLFRNRARDNAPVRAGNLRDSASMTVVDNGVAVRIVPATQHWLTPQQISKENERKQQPPHWYGAMPPKGSALGRAEGGWESLSEEHKREIVEEQRRMRHSRERPQTFYNPLTRTGQGRRTGPLRPES